MSDKTLPVIGEEEQAVIAHLAAYIAQLQRGELHVCNALVSQTLVQQLDPQRNRVSYRPGDHQAVALIFSRSGAHCYCGAKELIKNPLPGIEGQEVISLAEEGSHDRR